MAKWLPKSGIDVFVITSGMHDEEIIFNENIISVKSNRYLSKKNYFKYFSYLFKIFFIKICRLVWVQTRWEQLTLRNLDKILCYAKPDLVICSYPSLSAIRLGLNIAKSASLLLVTDFRDGFLLNPLEASLSNPNSNKYRYYLWLRTELLKTSKLVTVASTSLADEFISGAQNLMVKVIFNGFEDENSEPLVTKNPKFHHILFDEQYINVVHTGRLSLSESGTSIYGLVRGLQFALKKDSFLVDKVRFHFVGELSFSEKLLLRPFVKIGLVSVWGHVDRSTALAAQTESDFLFLITKPMASHAISGKLIEYLRLNKFVMALTSGSEAEKILRNCGLGLFAAPDNPSDICDLILKVSNLGKIKPMENSPYIKRFSASIVMKELVEALHRLNRS